MAHYKYVYLLTYLYIYIYIHIHDLYASSLSSDINQMSYHNRPTGRILRDDLSVRTAHRHVDPRSNARWRRSGHHVLPQAGLLEAQ